VVDASAVEPQLAVNRMSAPAPMALRQFPDLAARFRFFTSSIGVGRRCVAVLAPLNGSPAAGIPAESILQNHHGFVTQLRAQKFTVAQLVEPNEARSTYCFAEAFG